MKELVVISGKGGTGKTSVLGALASLAADRLVEYFHSVGGEAGPLQKFLFGAIGRFAVVAEDAHEALGQYRSYGRRDQVRLDTEVQQPEDNGDGVGRMNRGKDEMPRHRRAHRDVGRLAVAYLADEYDVRFLAQDASKAAREGDPGLRVY